MSRRLSVGRRVRHRTTRRDGIVVASRGSQFGSVRYMVRWDGNDHASGEYGIRDLEPLARGLA